MLLADKKKSALAKAWKEKLKIHMNENKILQFIVGANDMHAKVQILVLKAILK